MKQGRSGGFATPALCEHLLPLGSVDQYLLGLEALKGIPRCLFLYLIHQPGSPGIVQLQAALEHGHNGPRKAMWPGILASIRPMMTSVLRRWVVMTICIQAARSSVPPSRRTPPQTEPWRYSPLSLSHRFRRRSYSASSSQTPPTAGQRRSSCGR